jgi:ankyrin repeat protein
MEEIGRAAKRGDLAEVERLVGLHPGWLNDRDRVLGATPLMWACLEGHVGVVWWLLDHGAVTKGRDVHGCTALWLACSEGYACVVRLLLDRGADPTTADHMGATPLIAASYKGHLEVVRLLLGEPSVIETVNHRADLAGGGVTALWMACYWGRGEVARALLASGADPTIATTNRGITPMAIAKHTHLPRGVTAEGRRECVAVLMVRPPSFFSFRPSAYAVQ